MHISFVFFFCFFSVTKFCLSKNNSTSFLVSQNYRSCIWGSTQGNVLVITLISVFFFFLKRNSFFFYSDGVLYLCRGYSKTLITLNKHTVLTMALKWSTSHPSTNLVCHLQLIISLFKRRKKDDKSNFLGTGESLAWLRVLPHCSHLQLMTVSPLIICLLFVVFFPGQWWHSSSSGHTFVEL